MDRNGLQERWLQALKVATREGGVDRNFNNVVDCTIDSMSPPARVAWIETTQRQFLQMLI